MKSRLRLGTVAFTIAVLLLREARAGSVPDWMAAAAERSPEIAPSDAPALDLLREERHEVARDGMDRFLRRRVTRVYQRGARISAVESIEYDRDGDRVVQARAWSVTPAGETFEYSRKRAVDVPLDPRALVTDMRLLSFDLSGEALPGAVLGWEFEVERRRLFPEIVWPQQGELPVALTRFALRPPQGAAVRAVCLAGEPVEPRKERDDWIWEKRDLTSLLDEPMCPPLAALVPRLAVCWRPERSDPTSATFDDWVSVGRWVTERTDPRRAPDDSVRLRARVLTAGARDEAERVRCAGRFVRSLPYVATDLDLTRGKGYEPRPPSQVLRQGYGDCKDKASLLRALLREVGVDSWLTLVNLGASGAAATDWTSPGNFNHCILAVKAPWAIGTTACIDVPGFGPLLLIDATDALTSIGATPSGLEGEPALVVAGDSSRLVRVPEGTPEGHRVEVQVRARLEADGALHAEVLQHAAGAPARRLRAASREPAAFRAWIERWVSSSVGGARVTDQRLSDDPDSAAVTLAVTFHAAHHGARPGDSWLAFRPVLVSYLDVPDLKAGARRLPVELRPQSFHETAIIRLPAGFRVEELPEPVFIETGFARYEMRCEAAGDSLVVHRTEVLPGARLPADRYAEVSSFFQRVRELEQQTILLARR